MYWDVHSFILQGIKMQESYHIQHRDMAYPIGLTQPVIGYRKLKILK